MLCQLIHWGFAVGDCVTNKLGRCAHRGKLQKGKSGTTKVHAKTASPWSNCQLIFLEGPRRPDEMPLLWTRAEGPDASLTSEPCGDWTRFWAYKPPRASRDKALRQPIDCVALTVANDVTVDPEGYTDVAVAELIPDHSDRGTALN